MFLLNPQAAVTALEENDPFDKQFYQITVYTGFPSSSGTTSNVYIQLSGDEGQTEPRHLRDGKRRLFQTRAENVFLASFSDPIGDMQFVKVWHDNTGTGVFHLFFLFSFAYVFLFNVNTFSILDFFFGTLKHRNGRIVKLIKYQPIIRTKHSE